MSSDVYQWNSHKSNLKFWLDSGVLVKVERCDHGMIDPHNIYLSESSWIMGEPDHRCSGSPTLVEADDE